MARGNSESIIVFKVILFISIKPGYECVAMINELTHSFEWTFVVHSPSETLILNLIQKPLSLDSLLSTPSI